MQIGSKDIQNDVFTTILAEKIVIDKFKVQYHSMPNNNPREDDQRRFSSEDQTSNQTYTNLKSFNLGIILFDVKTHKFVENFSNISLDTKVNLTDRQFSRDLDKNSNNSSFALNKNTPVNDFSYKIIFSVKSIKGINKNEMTNSFTHYSVKNLDMSKNGEFANL